MAIEDFLAFAKVESVYFFDGELTVMKRGSLWREPFDEYDLTTNIEKTYSDGSYLINERGVKSLFNDKDEVIIEGASDILVSDTYYAVKKDYQYTVYDKQMKPVHSNLANVRFFDNGFYAIQKQDQQSPSSRYLEWSLYDNQNLVVYSFWGRDIKAFGKNLFLTTPNYTAQNLLDQDGKVLISHAGRIFGEGQWIGAYQDGQYSLYTKDGRTKLIDGADKIKINQDFYIVSKEGQNTVYNCENKQVTDSLSNVQCCGPQRYAVQDDQTKEWTLYHLNGDVIIEKATDVEGFSNGFYAVGFYTVEQFGDLMDGRPARGWALFQESGEQISSFVNNIQVHNKGFYEYYNYDEGKRSLYDPNGQKVVEGADYQFLTDENIFAQKNGFWYMIPIDAAKREQQQMMITQWVMQQKNNGAKIDDETAHYLHGYIQIQPERLSDSEQLIQRGYVKGMPFQPDQRINE